MLQKYFFLFICLVFLALSARAQNRNATVKVLNNYVLYSNANITALDQLEKSLERYNDLFNEYLRKNKKLGGEEYEKPKASPFLDEDLFTINTDNPDYLYSVALKESAALPAAVKTELNNTMKSMYGCSKRLVQLVDSMSLIFSSPLMNVTKNEKILPYKLLAEASTQLQWSKKYRNQLFTSLNNYYLKNCPLPNSSVDYMRSVVELNKGMLLCQKIMDDLSKNESTNIPFYVKSLDSIYTYLDKSELLLLKGLKPLGNSRNYPNPNYFNGFDLYTRYEKIINGFSIFIKHGNRFINKKDHDLELVQKCVYFHTEFSSYFNGYGLAFEYNEYVSLIGGGKMKIESEVGTLWRGWTDGKNTLPPRSILFWMKETPRFDIAWTETE